MKRRRDPTGILNLDKPAGMTSNQALQQVRRALGVRRAGHAGTLDPAATGVLPILVGTTTRLMEYLAGSTKDYRATVRLGLITDSLDLDGAITETLPVPETIDEASIEAILAEFIGRIEQQVPLYSAVRVDGQRLYALARQGHDPKRPTRQVFIERITLLEWNPPDLEISVTCGKGTYIRQLAADIGKRLTTGATLAALRRERVGPFAVTDAVPLEGVVKNASTSRKYLLDQTRAVSHIPPLVLTNDLCKRLLLGQRLAIEDGKPDGLRTVFDESDHLLAIAELAQGRLQPRKVLGAQD
ncbi:MAG: tRNA pseudouridine(55) synthase TruB [Deltaproteobacteria bacterium]|nr:tRNA pseudouridine(55) synthase TruB [Deltaproteobacteria bacterium]